MIEFNKQGYVALIRRFLDAGYTIVPATAALGAPAPAMFLRHDVDFSLELAVEMGEVEKENGVSSTYYVMVANDFYNVLDMRGRANLARLVELGHEVGLHWDSITYPEDRDNAVRQFRTECNMLSIATGRPVRTASQHRPVDSPFLNFDDLIEIEAYSAAIRARYAYVSDSSMRWREKTPLHFLAEEQDVQFTAHPVWWMTNATEPEYKLKESVNRQHSLRDGIAQAFIDRMNAVLLRRKEYDAKFRQQRGWTEG